MFGEIFAVAVVVALLAWLTVATMKPTRHTVKTRIIAADARRAAEQKAQKPETDRPRPLPRRTDPDHPTPDEIGYAVSEMFRP